MIVYERGKARRVERALTICLWRLGSGSPNVPDAGRKIIGHLILREKELGQHLGWVQNHLTVTEALEPTGPCLNVFAQRQPG